MKARKSRQESSQRVRRAAHHDRPVLCVAIDGVEVDSLDLAMHEMRLRLDALRPICGDLVDHPLDDGELGAEKKLQCHGVTLGMVIRDMEELIEKSSQLARSAR